ncbi:MAG: LamG-like jellyroll fold domain-containing protein [Candidatus Binataceae bacterium]
MILAGMSLAPARGVAQAGTVTYYYDALGRIAGVTDQNGNSVTYTYDAVGNLISITSGVPTGEGSSGGGSSQVSISEFSPQSGAIGSTVTIYGSGFSATATQDSVAFNGTTGTITAATATAITATVPAGASTGPLTVTVPGGSATSNGAFTVTGSSAGPTITGFTPASGTPGTTITITGTNFQPNAADDNVALDGQGAIVNSASATTISAVVPPSANSGPITVTTPNGSAISSTDFFIPPPGINPSTEGSEGQTTLGGAATAVSIGATNQQGMVVFNAVAGQVVSVFASNSTFPGCIAATVNLLAPDWSTVSSMSLCNTYGLIPATTLPETGTYTVQILPSGSNTGSMNINVYNAAPVVATTTEGGATIGITTTVPGQYGQITFAGNSGDIVSVLANNSTFPGCIGLTVNLIAPDGSTVSGVSTCSSWGLISAMTLSETGTYTVQVVPGTPNPGSVNINVYDAAPDIGTIAIGGSPVTVTTTAPGQAGDFTFSGTSGQTISLLASNSTYGGCIAVSANIYAPDGSTVGSMSTCSSSGLIGPKTLSQSGTYTVQIVPGGAGTGSLTLSLYNAAPVNATISIEGAALTASTSVPGQVENITFGGTANEPVSIEASNSTYTGCIALTVALLDPNLNQLESMSLCGSSGFLSPINLPETGTYTIQIQPGGANTGSVTITLYTATTITNTIAVGGPAVTLATNVPEESGVLSFSGTAGQIIALNVGDSTYQCCNLYTEVAISLFSPDATEIGSTVLIWGTASIGPIELPATGTYTIVISPVGTSGGSASYQITNYSDLSSSVNTSDTYAQTILSDNPIGYWRLDESSLATAANAEPTGVQYGEPGPTSPDNAIAIKGSQTYVSTTTEFNNPQTFSLEVWFNTTTAEGGRLAGFENVQVGEGSTAYDRLLYMTNSGNVVFGIYNGGFQTVQSSSTYSDGNWHHAVATYSSGAAVLYVDGNSVATGNLGQAQDYSGWWRWGGGSAWGGGGGTWTSAPIDLSFKGLLGEAALYSTALTASQVSTHYAAAAGGNYDSTVSSDDPVGYWKLNESGGLTLADSSGNADNGTVQIQAFNGVYQGGVTLGQPGVISTDSAILLDGSSGEVTLPLLSNTASNVTLECWTYITSATHGALIQIGASSGGYGIGIGSGTWDNSGTNLIGLYEYVRWLNPSNTPTLSLNTWHYVVLVIDGSGNPTLYLDGTPYTLSAGSPEVPSGSSFIGNDPAASTRYFAGTVDEAAVYNYALSATQITNHYNAR